MGDLIHDDELAAMIHEFDKVCHGEMSLMKYPYSLKYPWCSRDLFLLHLWLENEPA